MGYFMSILLCYYVQYPPFELLKIKTKWHTNDLKLINSKFLYL